MGPRKRYDTDAQPLLSKDGDSFDNKAMSPRLAQRSLGRGSGSRLRSSILSRRSDYELENKDSDVAFTLVLKREGEDTGEFLGETSVDIAPDIVSEAVQDAVQDACGQAVQDAVQEAVQDAIQQALEDNVRFDVRANFFTLIAITGVILFWRGIWSLWDKLFGFSIWSELGSIAAGLVIMITFRLIGVPLLDGLPSG